MLNVAISIAAVLLGAAMVLSLYRLLVGPSVPDRVLALDTVFVNTVGLVLLLGIVFETDLYFEAVLIIAMMGFVGTCALAKYVLRGDLME
ncbi:MAG: K+/H+ antiporter subunit F [Nannocystaceae bacterium]|nr:K+/H+ antiporter subunit F [bacterium]